MFDWHWENIGIFSFIFNFIATGVVPIGGRWFKIESHIHFHILILLLQCSRRIKTQKTNIHMHGTQQPTWDIWGQFHLNQQIALNNNVLLFCHSIDLFCLTPLSYTQIPNFNMLLFVQKDVLYTYKLPPRKQRPLRAAINAMVAVYKVQSY